MTYTVCPQTEKITEQLQDVLTRRGANHRAYLEAGSIPDLHERVAKRTEIREAGDKLDWEEFLLNRELAKFEVASYKPSDDSLEHHESFA